MFIHAIKTPLFTLIIYVINFILLFFLSLSYILIGRCLILRFLSLSFHTCFSYQLILSLSCINISLPNYIHPNGHKLPVSINLLKIQHMFSFEYFHTLPLLLSLLFIYRNHIYFRHTRISIPRT